MSSARLNSWDIIQQEKYIIKAQWRKKCIPFPKPESPVFRALTLQNADLESSPSGLGRCRCSVEREVTQAGERSEMLHGWFLLSQSPVSRLLFQPAPAPSIHPDLGLPGIRSNWSPFCLVLGGLGIGSCPVSRRHFPFPDHGRANVNTCMSLEKDFLN